MQSSSTLIEPSKPSFHAGWILTFIFSSVIGVLLLVTLLGAVFPAGIAWVSELAAFVLMLAFAPLMPLLRPLGLVNSGWWAGPSAPGMVLGLILYDGILWVGGLIFSRLSGKSFAVSLPLLGFLSGLFAGVALAIPFITAVTALLAGVFWLWVFGDSPWPGWVDRFMQIVLGTGGIGLIAFCAVWGRAAGRRAAQRSLSSQVKLASMLLIAQLLWTPLAVIAVSWQNKIESARARKIQQGRERPQTALEWKPSQKITGLSVQKRPDGSGADIEAVLEGQAEGEYVLEWEAHGGQNNSTLLSERRNLHLPKGSSRHRWSVDYTPLIARWRAVALNDPNATVGSNAGFEIRLLVSETPGSKATAETPPNLALPDSRNAPLNLSFLSRPDGFKLDLIP